MKKLKTGDVLSLEVVHEEGLVGLVNATKEDGGTVPDLCRIYLDASEEPVIELSYIKRDKDHKVVRSGSDGSLIIESERFVFSGKIEVTLLNETEGS